MPPSGLDVGGAGRVVALSIHIPVVPGWMHALLEDEAVYGQCEERTVTVREERKAPPESRLSWIISFSSHGDLGVRLTWWSACPVPAPALHGMDLVVTSKLSLERCRQKDQEQRIIFPTWKVQGQPGLHKAISKKRKRSPGTPPPPSWVVGQIIAQSWFCPRCSLLLW